MGAFGKLSTHKQRQDGPPQQEPDPQMAYISAGLVPNGTLSGKGAPKWCVMCTKMVRYVHNGGIITRYYVYYRERRFIVL